MIAVSGPSGAGKTTLIVRLIPLLRARGLRVGYLKSTHHVPAKDDRRKDTGRARAAGADPVHIVRRRPGLDLAAEAARVPDCDLVLVEGGKMSALPKIEVRQGASLFAPDDPRVVAIVTREPDARPLPQFAPDDLDEVAGFVADRVVGTMAAPMALDTASPLAALTGPIRDDLARVEAEITRMTRSGSPALEALLDHVGRFAGKRLRPAFTMLSARLFGPVTPAHDSVAAIIELIHTATLVHDDILDESSMRRRVETINTCVGNETAVLLGDYLFATCFKEAATQESRFVSRYLAEIVAIVCRGEILQVHHRHDFELTEETYFSIIRDKTAALYAAALRCGGELSGAAPEQCEALNQYGYRVGCAFQIIDDILDLTGEESAVGKSLGTDLEKAKMTLPLLRLRDRATPEDRERVRQIVLSHDPGERRTVLPLLEEYGAVDSARATAEKLVADAHVELEKLPHAPERDLLRRAAEYVLARDR